MIEEAVTDNIALNTIRYKGCHAVTVKKEEGCMVAKTALKVRVSGSKSNISKFEGLMWESDISKKSMT